MFKNYFIVAFLNLLLKKFYAAINMLSASIGLTAVCSFFICAT